MNKLEIFLKRHSSSILTVVGATGVIVTTVLAVKATPKAISLIEDRKRELNVDKLTPMETVKTAWKPYIPATLVGFGTIACIFGANILSAKNQASLISAYALLDSSYKEYQSKVNSTCGKDLETSLRHEIIRSRYDHDIDLDYDEMLFYDYTSRRFFKSTMQKVMCAETKFKEEFTNRGYACLNEYYDYLHIPYVDYGYQLGWLLTEDNDPYNCKELEFEYEEMSIDENLKCWIIMTNLPPSTDYII